MAMMAEMKRTIPNATNQPGNFIHISSCPFAKGQLTTAALTARASGMGALPFPPGLLDFPHGPYRADSENQNVERSQV
jgi:hypothetical protein